LGNEFVGKNSEKPSEDKPSEQPQPKTKTKIIRFHYDYCGRDGHKGEFCLKRKREERIAKEWANKDRYRPSNGVLEPRMQMPKAKASDDDSDLGRSKSGRCCCWLSTTGQTDQGDRSDRCWSG
jgi:hypothetical protein